MRAIAEQIKGISVVIGAETTGLGKALEDVNKKSRSIQGELRQVEKLLKLDPTNTELLAQKQKLLSEAVANTSEKLNRLKSVQEQVNQQFKKGDISEEKYRAFQREIAKSEQELQRFESRIQKVERGAKSLGDTIQEIGDSAGSIGGKLSVGTASVVGFAALATEGTRELRTELAKLETNTKVAGANIDIVNQAYREMYAITGELDSNVEGLSNLLAAGFDGTQMTQAMEAVAGAAIRFKDTLKFEGIADGLQETLATGAAIGPFAELLDRTSVNLDDFNKGLKEAIKNGTQQQYVLDVLSKRGLPQVYEEYRKNNQALIDNANASYDLQISMAELAKKIEPIMTRITKQVTGVVNVFNDLSPAGQDAAIAIAGVTAVAGPLLITLSSGITVLRAFPVALAAIGGPATVAIGVLAALGAAFVAYKDRIDAAIMSFDTWMRQQAWFKAIGGAQLPQNNYNSVGAHRMAEQGSFTPSPTPPAVSVSIPKSFAGLGGAASDAGSKAAKAAEDTRKAWEKTADILGIRLQIVQARYDALSNSTGQSSDKTKQLVSDLEGLYKQLDYQKEIIRAVNVGYQASVKAKGATSEETLKLALRLDQEKKAQSDLEKEIYDTTQAIKDHATELRNLSEEVSDVEKKYREDLADALAEYTEKVKETNQQLAEEEKKLTDQYEQELDNRAKALSNFVGLFDAVATKDVSGQQLLDNLRGQVDAFDQWQENIADLAAKGVDEGLIDELRQMGPKAGPEIAALNTLTDEQLQEYVALWREKNQEAREEAVIQLQQQRVEMQQKLMEIREAAREQLEAYRVEWEKKNAEIRKNAEEEMKRIEEKFKDISEAGTNYGVSLVSNFVDGMESQFDRLRATLEEMAATVDSYMPHSPAKRGPLRKIMEWGPALVGSLVDGINESLPSLESAVSNMARIPALGMAGGSTTNHYGGNTIQITVQDGEDLLRTLRRLGVNI